MPARTILEISFDTTLSTEDQTLSIQQKFDASAHHANILWTLDFIAVKYLPI
jgi:hypothetical protein